MKNLLTLLKDNAKLNVVGGITLLLLGALCINLPYLSGLTIAGFVSLAMVAYGISTSIFAFTKNKVTHKILNFISGILVTLLGVFMLINPIANLYTLAMISVCYFIIDGVMNLVTTYQIRKTKLWGWSLFHGIISLALAASLIVQWPLSSIYIVGTLVGIRFIFNGLNIALLASTGFGVVDAIETSQKSDNVEDEKVNKVQHA